MNQDHKIYEGFDGCEIHYNNRLQMIPPTLIQDKENSLVLNSIGQQKGDIFKTHGSVNKIVKKTKFKPKVKIKTGIEEFLKWYKKYYKRIHYLYQLQVKYYIFCLYH